MTIKEFLQDHTLTSVETADNLIINLVCGDEVCGINVDTTNIESGTILIRSENFIITDNILSVDDMFVNIETTNILG
jgi:hypothetical protein